jgi:hypothetical protein
MDHANCIGVDPDAMFPGTGRGDADEAKAICKRCSVRAECLDHALAHYEVYGVWGGLTEEERRTLRQGRPVGRPKMGHGTRACYQSGCRRPECRDANAAYGRRRRFA